MNLNFFYKPFVFLLLLIVPILNGCRYTKKETSYNNDKSDSIKVWIRKSKNTNLSILKRKTYLHRAYYKTLLYPEDTIKSKTLSKIAYQALKLKDPFLFKKSNKEALTLSTQLKHNFSIGDAHWNYAYYQLSKEAYDSVYYHYNKAHYFFNSIDHQYYTAKMLYNLAVIKAKFGDYTGSETLIVKSISKYKSLKKYKSLYESYNHLAVLYKRLKEYDRALYYHNRALEYLDNIKDKKTFYEGSLNNIGLVYKELGNYNKAISYFNAAIESDSIKIKNIKLYSRLIDNRAYCKFLNNDTTNVKKDLYEALSIRDSLDHKAGIIVNKIHLGEYYSVIKDTAKAIKFITEANILGKEIKSNSDYLTTLKLLSKIDKPRSVEYLNTYLSLNEQLQDKERKIRNKFTRIAFETDEYIAETKRLTQQKIWISIASLIILLLIALLYFIKIQKSKNEKLMFETAQQKANEEIYILSLKEHTKLEEGRTRERNRISEELHDGVLGKLFGTRLGLGFLDLKGSQSTLQEFQSFLSELQDIEKEIRTISHDLKCNMVISETNFITLINDLFKNKSALGKFAYQIEISNHIVWEKISEIIKVNLYRILQEALQNIIKHAEAKHVNLKILSKTKQVVLIISDNGKGVNTSKKRKGIGIKNIHSRVLKLDGKFSIHSEINNGTTLQITIPLF